MKIKSYLAGLLLVAVGGGIFFAHGDKPPQDENSGVLPFKSGSEIKIPSVFSDAELLEKWCKTSTPFGGGVLLRKVKDVNLFVCGRSHSSSNRNSDILIYKLGGDGICHLVAFFVPPRESAIEAFVDREGVHVYYIDNTPLHHRLLDLSYETIKALPPFEITAK